jgi:NADH:ubiquinone oxidoreductase subunit 5 (subunit L)/multisubunit Na+/H+ antiporter MnhA subunit
VWVVYRLADAAFLIAALTMHHLTGGGDFEQLMGSGPWPEASAAISEAHALFVGLLLLVAAAGKSALLPFSGWLPQGHGRTYSLERHFLWLAFRSPGAFLLLRVSPILERSALLEAIVVGLGLLTAVVAASMARVQADIKSALAFASLTQVGIIVAEIGLGFRYLALAHILGHACLRTLQLLRAPSLLHDYHRWANATGAHLHGSSLAWERLLPSELSILAISLRASSAAIWMRYWMPISYIRCCDCCPRAIESSGVGPAG